EFGTEVRQECRRVLQQQIEHDVAAEIAFLQRLADMLGGDAGGSIDVHILGRRPLAIDSLGRRREAAQLFRQLFRQRIAKLVGGELLRFRDRQRVLAHQVLVALAVPKTKQLATYKLGDALPEELAEK